MNFIFSLFIIRPIFLLFVSDDEEASIITLRVHPIILVLSAQAKICIDLQTVIQIFCIFASLIIL